MRDAYFYPVVIDDTNNTLIWNEGGQLTVTIPNGTYYLTGRSGFAPLSLFSVLTSALATAGATGTYTFSTATPIIDTEQTGAGLLIGCDTSFSIEFTDASFTFDPRYLGFDGTADINSVTNQIQSEYTLLGAWYSWTLTGGEATDRRSFEERELVESSTRTADAYQIAWNTDTVRNNRYEYVPAAHVFINRTSFDGYGETGQIATDTNAWERVWSEGSKLKQILVVYDVQDGQTIATIADDELSDVVKFNDLEQRRNIRNTMNLQVTKGEMYELSINLLVLESSYDY